MIIVHFDGSCKPNNPGGRCYGGAVIKDAESGRVLQKLSEQYIPDVPNETSNNVGEYFGLNLALVWLLNNGYQDEQIRVYGDSKLVITQMTGRWRMKGGFYRKIGVNTRIKKDFFTNIKFFWIPREQNGEADALI